MATNAPQDDWHKTGLRLPRDLHARIHEAAAVSGRSYNAEIVSRLEASLSMPPEATAIKALTSLSELGSNKTVDVSIATLEEYVREQQRKERESIEKLITSAVGATVHDALKEFQEQERRERDRLLEQISAASTIKAFVGDLPEMKEQFARQAAGLPAQKAKTLKRSTKSSQDDA